jgi:energy-coupling factor transporter ATP-binding protein EcfA2
VRVAGLAISSGRSLFLYGPSGNGKTSLSQALRGALRGDLWIPYCICIGSHVIRIYDPQCHEVIQHDWPPAVEAKLDRRWVHIRRPFIIVGGELTLEALDLTHSYSRGHYQAPLHIKANGGLFLLDDFGCQKVQPHELVNRWIIPLEQQVDYLTLQTGQQIQVPFRQLLIVSTNLKPDDVTTPGLLRRIGYRLFLGDPTPESYIEILSRYCARCGLTASSEVVQWLMERHQQENRPLRSCEPRDLIERVLDICRYRKQPPRIDTELLEIAWYGYFSN